MIRKSLDMIYRWSGFASAFFLVAIAVLTLAQILGRFAPKLVLVDST